MDGKKSALAERNDGMVSLIYFTAGVWQQKTEYIIDCHFVKQSN